MGLPVIDSRPATPDKSEVVHMAAALNKTAALVSLKTKLKSKQQIIKANHASGEFAIAEPTSPTHPLCENAPSPMPVIPLNPSACGDVASISSDKLPAPKPASCQCTIM